MRSLFYPLSFKPIPILDISLSDDLVIIKIIHRSVVVRVRSDQDRIDENANKDGSI